MHGPDPRQDAKPLSLRAAALRARAGRGVHVRVYYGQSCYIHAKLLVVDGRTALVGSQNLSAESL